MLYLPQSLKQCSKCGEWRLASTVDFHLRKNRPLGLAYNCKNCANEDNRRKNDRNKERYKARSREYYRENKERLDAQHREYYWKNRNKRLEQNREYYQANREHIISYVRQWRQDNQDYLKQHRVSNKDRLLGSARKWRQQNRDRINQLKRESYYRHKEKTIKKHREYYLSNREQIASKNRQRYWADIIVSRKRARVNAANRRARELSAGGVYTALDIQKQYDAQAGKCKYCGCDVGDQYHADHYIPLNKGGSNGAENIVIACPTCNLRKHDKMPDEFIELLQKEKVT